MSIKVGDLVISSMDWECNGPLKGDIMLVLEDDITCFRNPADPADMIMLLTLMRSNGQIDRISSNYVQKV